MASSDTVRITRRVATGGVRKTYGTYTGPSSYVANGDPIAPNLVGLGRIEALQLHSWQPRLSGALPELVVVMKWDQATRKVLFYPGGDDNTEATAGTDFSTFSSPFEAMGY